MRSSRQQTHNMVYQEIKGPGKVYKEMKLYRPQSRSSP